MRTLACRAIILVCATATACTDMRRRDSDTDQASAIDSLNARIVDAYRTRDPQKYSQLYTDTAVFEWPAVNSVRGRDALAAMARDNWAPLNDMELRLIVESRRVAANRATEFGAFQQSWVSDSGVRMTEFGRYVHALVRQEDGTWRIDRFFGFEDSLRPQTTRR